MRKVIYNLVIAFIFIGTITINAQKFEQDYSKEIMVKKGTEVTLIADYADIEIIEWKKNKIKVDAVLTVESVSKDNAKKYLNFWKIDVRQNNNEVKIISKTKQDYDFHWSSDSEFEPHFIEMPEISLESLGILDTMNFSFPEINFQEIFKDSTFNQVFSYNFNFVTDSLNEGFNHFDFEKLKKNQNYLQEWQEANKDNFIKLREKALELALRNKDVHEKRMKIHERRMEIHRESMERYEEKRQKQNEKRLERLEEVNKRRLKYSKKRQNKIKEILKNRKKPKIRTKLIIRVPKGTAINMNVNYSKIKTN